MHRKDDDYRVTSWYWIGVCAHCSQVGGNFENNQFLMSTSVKCIEI